MALKPQSEGPNAGCQANAKGNIAQSMYKKYNIRVNKLARASLACFPYGEAKQLA